MLWTGDGTHDGAFNRAEAVLGREARWNWHLQQNVLLFRNFLQGDKNPARADIHRGTEFENGTTIETRAVNKNGKREGEPLPAA